MGMDGDQREDLNRAGAVYVFTRTNAGAEATWSQQSYIKAAYAGPFSIFGTSLALSGDTLAVGASNEASGSSGVEGDPMNAAKPGAGAAYLFTRSGADLDAAGVREGVQPPRERGFRYQHRARRTHPGRGRPERWERRKRRQPLFARRVGEAVRGGVRVSVSGFAGWNPHR